MLCGARGYAAIVQGLHWQSVETWHQLGFTRIPPMTTCFEKQFAKLPAAALEQALADWIAEGLDVSVDGDLQAVALDGKTLCGPLMPHQRAVHLLAALDQQTGCVLSQIPVDAKTNEHKAALKSSSRLCLKVG